ncbi:MAG: OsmC family protein [Vulcanimicrobiaceae bacterium]
MQSHTYSVRLAWTGCAAGSTTNYRAYSRDHTIEFKNKAPLAGSADPAFRGDPAKCNPEELLVASLSACHMLNYLALCSRQGIEVVSYVDNATGLMEFKDGAICFTGVFLRPVCTVRGNLEQAKRLHEQAHAECFIANSVNFPVTHEAQIVEDAT